MNDSIRYLANTILIISIVLISTTSHAVQLSGNALNLDQLLIEVKNSRQIDIQVNRQREKDFISQEKDQKKHLDQAKTKLNQLENLSHSLEQTFSVNEQKIIDKKNSLNKRLGNLKELFGHLTAASGDFRSNLENSIISAQYSGREAVFDQLILKMNSATLLPEVDEIESLWFEMMREMTESSKIVKFNTDVVMPGGEMKNQEIIRIGAFNLVGKDKYLSYSSETNSIGELSRQPTSNYTRAIQSLFSESASHARIGIDPTGPAGGSFLAALVDSPTLIERWHQGGIVGYIITSIGALAILAIIWRLFVLSTMESRILKLLKGNGTDNGDKNSNALSRVINIHKANPSMSTDTLEAKLSEAIIKEKPDIERSLPLLKIIAMVSPLLGLLGTVTGMIITFQAITIFGAGDPKAMAGGISSALVTTVLGLLVAIPTLFAHSLLNAKAQNILNILEHQSMGLIARHTEPQN